MVLTASGTVRAKIISNTGNLCSGDFGLHSPTTTQVFESYDELPIGLIADVGAFTSGQELVFYLDVSATWCETPREYSYEEKWAHLSQIKPNVWEIAWEDLEQPNGNYHDLVVQVGIFPADCGPECAPDDNPDQVMYASDKPFPYGLDGPSDRWGVPRGNPALSQYSSQSGGPIDLPIKIGKYLGPTNPDGTPSPQHSLFGTLVPLVIDAFDVDELCATDPCEMDSVLVNGSSDGFVGGNTLTGTNDEFSQVTLWVPASLLHFRTSYLDEAGGVNNIQILVDGLNTTDRWFVRIVDAYFDLPPAPEKYRPTVLIHGINGVIADMNDFSTSFASFGVDLSAIRPVGHDSGPFPGLLYQAAAQIRPFLEESGWDRVTIVAHSLGGLAARAYTAEHPDQVKTLIMFGTPNGGIGPLAASCIAATPMGDDQGGGYCQGVLWQLTSEVIQGYFNRFFPDQNGVRYLALAGDNHEGEGGACFFAPVLYGDSPNDGCIEVASAQFLWVGGAQPGAKEHILPPFHLGHSHEPMTGDLVDKVSCILYGACPWPDGGQGFGGRVEPAAAESTTTETQEVIYMTYESVPAGGSVDLPLAFEGAGTALVSAIVPDDDVSAAIGTTALTSFVGGATPFLSATLAQPNDQSIHIANGGTEPANVTLFVSILSDRHVSIESAPFVQLGSPLDLTVTLSAPIEGDSPVAELVDPQGARTPIALTPAGLGQWTATLSPTVAGANHVVASVAGPKPRLTSSPVAVGREGSQISSDFAESLNDVDGDRLVDGLVLSPSVTVEVPGTYVLVGSLVDESGSPVGVARTSAALVVGAQPMALAFDGSHIYTTGLAGPYRLVDLTLFNEASGLAIEAQLPSADQTAPYGINAFQHDRISFDPATLTGEAVDDDQDSVMDRWVVSGTITVEDQGSYTIESGLVAAGNAFVGAAKTTHTFSAGSNPFTLEFDGPTILATGKAGPYTVWMPIAYVADGSIPSSVLHPAAIAYDASATISTTMSFPSGSGSVEVWQRFSADGSSDFGDWTLAATSAASNRTNMLTVPLSLGFGTYELYSIAIDGLSGAREPAPLLADTTTPLRARGTSHVNALAPAGNSYDLSIPFSATYPTGSGAVELWQGSSTQTWSNVATSTTSPISLHVAADNFYCFYTIAVDGQTGARELPPTGNPFYGDACTIVDTIKPNTVVDPVPAITENTLLPITLSWDDAGTAELWSRYRASTSDSWGPWEFAHYSFDWAWTFSFPFGHGVGYYEFVSVGTDDAGNQELRPDVGDAQTQYAPSLSSLVGALPEIAQANGFVWIPFTAGYATGSGSVELWQRLKPFGATEFGAWTNVGTFVDSPIVYGLPPANGIYEFYSIAVDTNGMREDPPASADASTMRDTTAPIGAVAALPARVVTDSLDIDFSASDVGTGISRVFLFHRYRLTDTDSWSSWSLFGDVYPLAGHVVMTLDSGEGYYEFSARAIDRANNMDSSLVPVEAWTHFTTSTAPSSSVDALPAWSASSATSVTVRADYASGSGSVELWQRYQAQGSATWSEWTITATGTSPQFDLNLASGDGRYEFYSVAVDGALRELPPTGANAFTVLDTAAPVSAAGALPAGVRLPDISVPYSASDGTASGIASIELWQRFKAAGSSSWSAWANVGTNIGTSPFWASFGTARGRYEFYTIATDNAGNREVAPATADAFTVFDTTAPTSTAGPLSSPVALTDLSVPYTATDVDGSGIASAELWRRFKAAGSGTWSSWTMVASGTSSPIEVSLGSGDGRYEFYTRAIDAAGNREGAAGSADAFTVLDETPPVSTVGTVPASVSNTALTVPYTASDTSGSGVASVELWQRFRASGSSTWSEWDIVSTRTTSPFTASLGAGDGRYEFYTVGIDVATNREEAPEVADAFTVLVALPVTSVTAMASPVRTTAASIAYTASGAPSVELWQRYRAAGSSTWSAWVKVATNSSSPFSVSLSSGAGRYEFYTIGVNGSTREAAPSGADTFTVLDTTGPTSTVGTVPSTASGASAAIPFTATDNTNGSGIGTTELWARFRANDSILTGTWTLITSGSGASGSLTLPFASGAGVYDLSTIAIDAAGNREGGLATPSTVKSTVRAISWAASSKVNTDAGSALQDSPACAAATDGTVYCVWSDSRSGNPDIYFSQRNTTTGAWSAEIKLNADTGTKIQESPAIAVDGAGNLYVVWADDRNTTTTANMDIYFAKRTGSTWGANVKLNTDTGNAVQNQPRVSVSSAGIAVVVWTDARSSQKNVYSGRLPAGSSTWSANFKVTTNTAAVKGRPDVALATDGTAHAVWEDSTAGNANILYATLGPTATAWSANTTVSDDATTGAESWPRIGLTSTTGPLVAWLDGRVATVQVRVRQKTGSTWNASIQLSDAAARPLSLAFVVKPAGGILAAWGDSRGTPAAVFGSQCEAGSTGVTRCAVSEAWSDQSGAASAPALAATSSRVFLGWRDDTAGGGDVRFRIRTPS